MADETNDKQRLDEHGLDTLLSNLSNKVASKTSLDSKVDKVTSATNGNIAEFTSSGNIADSGVSVDDIVEVAEGKTATYIVNVSQNEVFNSQNDTVTTTKIITVDGTEINVSEIRKGDIILVTDTNVPDRWFGGTNIFYKMETSKIDLSSYYTRTETDAKFVEQVSGKQLSTNDYTNEDKSTLQNNTSDVTVLKENLTELEQKAITSTEEESYEPTVPRDADTLGGIAASEYMRNVYSDEEVKIGEWFGQDLYRRIFVYTGLILSIQTDNKLQDDFPIHGNNVISLKTILKQSDGSFVENSAWIGPYIYQGALFLKQTFTGYLSDIYVVVEYVK